MMEQDSVHIGYEADVTAHLLDTNGKRIGVTGLLDRGAVVSVMPIKLWKEILEIYVAGRTPITVLHMGGRDLWMSFRVVENLDDSDQFVLDSYFVRIFGQPGQA